MQMMGDWVLVYQGRPQPTGDNGIVKRITANSFIPHRYVEIRGLCVDARTVEMHDFTDYGDSFGKSLLTQTSPPSTPHSTWVSPASPSSSPDHITSHLATLGYSDQHAFGGRGKGDGSSFSFIVCSSSSSCSSFVRSSSHLVRVKQLVMVLRFWIGW
jgi:hypothetical protein